ncbi:MAG TPA: outer membrane protein assembly factor BamD [Nitrospiraceae bacterium]|jgi:outer membrane protein assembly factor BamD|nr:outer membrane protein assembly factor BamD [Nitrospiraceae bacterium]
MRVYVTIAATVLVGLLLVSCSSTSKNQQAKDKTTIPVTDADEQVLKTDPIERNYDPHVIMKRAEAFFEKEDYAEAAVEYQHFLDLHRAHMLAPYAQYRLGLSHYKQVTTLDRDPEHVRQTIEAMEKLLKEYPGSAYELDAQAKIKEGREHLAAYEIYVGKHYYRQAAYLAALHRFERVLALYHDLEDSAEAHYYLARTYKDIGAPERAVEHLTVLLTQYPKAKIRKDGQALLASLNGKAASMLAAAPSPPSKTSLPAPLPPLPKTRSLSMNPADIPPAGANGYGHTPAIIDCGLNILC